MTVRHTLTMQTPRGRSVTYTVRADTADHNNVWSACQEDEYRLRDVELGTGWALDIGAHIGGVTIPLALDNPDARIIAVEGLSENVALLRENVEAAGVADRVTILHAIAHRPGVKSGVMRWNFSGSEAGQHHRYIGNASQLGITGGDEETVAAVSLSETLALAGGFVAFCKIDCEGGEYDFLDDPFAAPKVREYRGEFHDGYQRIVEMLGESHDVRLTSGTDAFGAFEAVAR